MVYGISGLGPSANSVHLAFNRTFGAFKQGNTYDDYCDKGTDSDGDGYVDTGTLNVDYPQNGTVSSKILAPITDFHPKSQSCVSEVQVGSSGGGGNSGAAAAAGGSGGGAGGAAAAAGGSSGPKKAETGEVASAQEARDSIKEVEVVQQQISKDVIQLTFTLENTGNKTIRLSPYMEQYINDPYMFVTRKTLGGSGSLLSDLSCISYAKDSITGKLLESELLNAEEVVLKPGETLSQVFQVKEGFGVPKLKIQFTTFNETVFEKEVETQQESVSGAALDLDTDGDVFDLYAVIFPSAVSQEILDLQAQQEQNNELTGMVTAENTVATQNNYNVEVRVTQKASAQRRYFPSAFSLAEFFLRLRNGFNVVLTELYGPYTVEGEGFVFGQQFKYDPARCSGDYDVTTTIYQENKALVTNTFPLSLQ